MISVPKKVSYALTIVWECWREKAKEKKPLSSRELSRKARLPQCFVAQITSELKNGGILESREGIGGGYWLSRGWERKSLRELLVILGEDKRFLECLDSKSACGKSKVCPVRRIWGRVEGVLLQELERINLGELK